MEFYRIRAELLPKVNFVDETEIHPPYVHRRRKAGEQILYVIKHGEMQLLEDDMPLVLKPGDICVLDAERTHEGTKATDCSYFYVHFKHPSMELITTLPVEEVLRKEFQQRQQAMKHEFVSYDGYDNCDIWLPKHWHIPKVTDQMHIFELLQQAIREDYSALENHKILCSCKIQEMLIEIARCFTTAEKDNYAGAFPESYYKVQKIQEWLGQSYTQDITSERLETEFQGNFDYMNRIFKKVMGQTIFQYLTQVRIWHAKRLIEQTTMHTGVIGEKVGYPDEYYFSKVFKKHVGMSPREYANSMMKHMMQESR